MSHVLRAGSTANGPWLVDVDPTDAGWRHTSLRVAALDAGQEVEFDTGPDEVLVLPLTGAARVRAGDQEFELAGRGSVFGEVTDYVYLPRHTSARIEATRAGRFALPGAIAHETLPARHCPAREARVELRGAGACSRQIVNYAISNPLRTDRLLVCEVLTPAGNWSSYPPHKHDEHSEAERELEEIYYFEFREDGPGPGMGFHATYGTQTRPIEVAALIGHGDVALVPHGWHGPCAAAPGHDLYYLNAMAGPMGAQWRSVDDPDHAWIRESWADQQIDPRLPMRPAATTGQEG